MTDHDSQAAAEINRILQERAQALAQSSADSDDHEDVSRVLVVEVGSEHLGLPIEAVREIAPLPDITALPGVARHWRGVVNLRGQVYPVLDMGEYLGIAGMPTDSTPHCVLVASGGTSMGLIVEGVADVRSVAVSTVRPPLDLGMSRGNVYKGLTDDLVALLDVDAIVSDPTLVVNERGTVIGDVIAGVA